MDCCGFTQSEAKLRATGEALGQQLSHDRLPPVTAMLGLPLLHALLPSARPSSMNQPPQSGSRAGKHAPRQQVFSRRQATLWCRCGSLHVAKRGLCAACYAREQHDRRFYAGLRSAVVARDGRLCRLCSTLCHAPAALVVHHRRPGRSRLAWLVALCRACHARVHRLGRVRRVYPELFLELWREQHPHAPEQLALVFRASAAQPRPQGLFGSE